jgi:hypothetical protein
VSRYIELHNREETNTSREVEDAMGKKSTLSPAQEII